MELSEKDARWEEMAALHVDLDLNVKKCECGQRGGMVESEKKWAGQAPFDGRLSL